MLREDRPDEQRLVAYVVLDDTAPMDSGSAEIVAGWRDLYDALYANSSTAGIGENFVGWNSSYDGKPIPHEHMQEWCSETVRRIQELAARRILEIGGGSGLLLSRLLTICEAYWCTDVSAQAIEILRRQVGHDEPVGSGSDNDAFLDTAARWRARGTEPAPAL
jgi:hypothetical protein